jgi:hypothetical protein
MHNLDDLELTLIDCVNSVTGSPGKYVQIFVNGRSLVDLVHAVELPQMIAEGRPTEHLEPGHYWPFAYPGLVHSLGGRDDCGDGKSELLTCTCGDFGCWPISARITVTENTVTWSEFENYHRSGSNKFNAWSYKNLGPFVFDRRKYERQLATVA